MTEFELLQLFKLSHTSSVIDRQHMEKYGGLFREIVLITETKCRVDFVSKENKLSDEGEISVYFTFESREKMIAQLEQYTKKKLSEWKRYFVDPEIFYHESAEWNQEPDYELFQYDFSNKEIAFPENYLEMNIKDWYWEFLYSGELKYNSTEEEIERCYQKYRQMKKY